MAQATDQSKRRPRILLGITGSVAAVKGPALALKLMQDFNADVRILLTRGGSNFWNERTEEYDSASWAEFKAKVSPYVNEECYALFAAERDKQEAAAAAEEDQQQQQPRVEVVTGGGSVVVHEAKDEWEGWNRMGDPILHIDLRNWADLVLIAPLSAHTLAKVATGLCDDPLTCCLRAWDYGGGSSGRPGKPVVLAPAMNTAMWDHPLTQSQLGIIKAFWHTTADEIAAGEGQGGVVVVNPKVSTLACGEVGAGAMANLDDIINVVRLCLGL